MGKEKNNKIVGGFVALENQQFDPETCLDWHSIQICLSEDSAW